uniref:Uncharacterized protein n=1 Tax=Arion vulgaris TaxID=1028688 RepID=A0A0B6ZVF5_9EUPU
MTQQSYKDLFRQTLGFLVKVVIFECKFLSKLLSCQLEVGYRLKTLILDDVVNKAN